MKGSLVECPFYGGRTLDEQDFDYSSPDTGTQDIECTSCGWKGIQNWEVTSITEVYNPDDDYG